MLVLIHGLFAALFMQGGAGEIIEFPWLVVDCATGEVVDEKRCIVKPAAGE